MADEKLPEPKVEFSDIKAAETKPKQFSRKNKIIAITVLIVVLLLGSVVSVAVLFVMRRAKPIRLTEVNLEEGESLTYRVHQDIEVKVGDVQKATIRAIVGIQVLNKTSVEYWFMLKFNLSFEGGNVNMRDLKIVTADYFLVRALTTLRTSDHGSNRAVEPFEVYGNHSTNEEQVRLVFGILEQLLPTVQRDLYEDVDGEKATGRHPLNPEKSPLLPYSVKMHRKANTSDKDFVLIKNHFVRSDFVNMSSEIDLDLEYSDLELINKSNGMVMEGRAYFSEQLNFGESVYNKEGFNVTMMNITLISHISLIETNYFGYAEFEAVNFHVFVKLVVPKTMATFFVKEDPTEAFSPGEGASNSSNTPSNVSLSSQQYTNLTNSSFTHLRRSRRAKKINVVRESWKKSDPVYLSVSHKFNLFKKKVLGITVRGDATISVTQKSGLEIEVKANLAVGKITLPDVISKKYTKNKLKEGKGTRTGHEWQKGITIFVPVYSVRLGVDFSIKCKINNQLSFPPDENSINPVKLAVQIEPSAEVTASVEGYISAYAIRAGAYGDGTLMKVGLPVTLSYQAARSPGRKWCLKLSARMTALELKAGIFYQWWDFWWGKWGTRNTLKEFGKWSAQKRNWDVLKKCTVPTRPPKVASKVPAKVRKSSIYGKRIRTSTNTATKSPKSKKNTWYYYLIIPIISLVL